MKKTILAAVVLAVVALASPSLASGHGREGGYIGAAAAMLRIECPTGTNFTCTDDSEVVPMIYIGGLADENFGMELGYLGTEFDAMEVNNGNTKGKLEYNAFYLAAIGRKPFDDNFAVYGKLGMSAVLYDTSHVQLNLPDDEAGFLTGVGMELSFDDPFENLAIRAEFMLLDLGAKSKVGSLNVIYRF